MPSTKNDGSEHRPKEQKMVDHDPTVRRRFKQSSTPGGRPEGAKNRKEIVRAIANERHTLNEAGKRRQLTTFELILLRLRNMAIEGKNVRALDEFHRLMKTYQPQETDSACGYLVVPAPITEEEAIAEGEKANAEAAAERGIPWDE